MFFSTVYRNPVNEGVRTGRLSKGAHSSGCLADAPMAPAGPSASSATSASSGFLFGFLFSSASQRLGGEYSLVAALPRCVSLRLCSKYSLRCGHAPRD